jgi:methionine synthase II (cobalamin-independent)
MDLLLVTGIGVPLVSALAGAIFFVHKNAQAERSKIADNTRAEIDKLIAARERDIAALHERVNATNKDLYDHKLTSATLFATVAAVAEFRKEVMGGMRDFRTEFMSSMKEIESRLDRIAERNDKNDRRDNRN